MQCAACGSTLSAPGAACTVCDPWATPARPAAQPAPLGLPQTTQIPMGPTTYLGSSLPRWYRLLIRRNPPVPTADLERAWRNTVISFAVNAVLILAFAVASAAAAHSRTSNSYQIALVVFVAGMVIAMAVGLAFRHKTWLGRVVALLGGRPHIGHAALLRIPAIARLNTVYTVSQYATYVFCVGIVLGHRLSWMAMVVVFAAALLLSAVQLALQSAARKPVAQLLGPGY